MKMNEYEKPELKFVAIRSEKNVAKTCWGGHGKSDTWYYDISGEGFVSFQISPGSCALNLTNVQYYKGEGVEGVLIDSMDPKYVELQDALVQSGGSDGNPFAGEGVDFPLKPDPSWS